MRAAVGFWLLVGHELEQLTSRERDVLRLLCGGLSTYAQLTEALCVSPNTVHYHLDQLRSKFHVSDRAQLVAFAWTHGLIDPREVVWRGDEAESATR
jgi:DNA-binding NarL/FixJ family response regulator